MSLARYHLYSWYPPGTDSSDMMWNSSLWLDADRSHYNVSQSLSLPSAQQECLLIWKFSSWNLEIQQMNFEIFCLYYFWFSYKLCFMTSFCKSCPLHNDRTPTSHMIAVTQKNETPLHFWVIIKPVSMLMQFSTSSNIVLSLLMFFFSWPKLK